MRRYAIVQRRKRGLPDKSAAGKLDARRGLDGQPGPTARITADAGPFRQTVMRSLGGREKPPSGGPSFGDPPGDGHREDFLRIQAPGGVGSAGRETGLSPAASAIERGPARGGAPFRAAFR
jgi:hypothetical protein